MGIGWTQARAVMCLLTAYERTGDIKYLETAERGINYAKNLQNMDRRVPITYGAFHEETPFSAYSFPRDAIEVADALLQWHVVTGDEDALYRAELFLDWFKRNAIHDYKGFGYWAHGEVRFDSTRTRNQFRTAIACEMGCTSILAHAYYVTGKQKYKTMALKFADTTTRNYLPTSSGPLRKEIKGSASHHTGSDGIIHNDDGGTVGLLNAYKLSGKQKYLDAAIQVADFYNSFNDPIPIFSGTGSVANILLEVDHITGKKSHRRKASQLTNELVKLQVNSGPKIVKGAFRGEDEGGKWYYKGSKNRDFVSTRVTAYSVLALFKLEGICWPRGYSIEF